MSARSLRLVGAAAVVASLSTLVSTAAAPAPAGTRAVSRTTRHLSFTATLSRDVVAPGARISVAVDVVPKEKMHVYAPGTEYRPLALAFDPQPWLRVQRPVYPEPTRYLFKPLNETMLVYNMPFRLVVDAVIGDVPEPARRSPLPLKATLSYQACDDSICFLPVSLPLEWRLNVRAS